MDAGAVVESARADPATTGCAVTVALRIVRGRSAVTMDAVGAAVRVQECVRMEFVEGRKAAAYPNATEKNAVMMDAVALAGNARRPSCALQGCAAVRRNAL